MINKIRTYLAKTKMYMGRTLAYVSLINAGMLLFLFLSKVKEAGYITVDLQKWFVPLLIITYLILYLIGWVDVHWLKAYSKEISLGFSYSPEMVEMHERLMRIEKMIEDLKKG